MSDLIDRVVVGDVIRISVALLRQIYDDPDHETEAVKLASVRTEADGTKILILEKIYK